MPMLFLRLFFFARIISASPSYFHISVLSSGVFVFLASIFLFNFILELVLALALVKALALVLLWIWIFVLLCLSLLVFVRIHASVFNGITVLYNIRLVLLLVLVNIFDYYYVLKSIIEYWLLLLLPLLACIIFDLIISNYQHSIKHPQSAQMGFPFGIELYSIIWASYMYVYICMYVAWRYHTSSTGTTII